MDTYLCILNKFTRESIHGAIVFVCMSVCVCVGGASVKCYVRCLEKAFTLLMPIRSKLSFPGLPGYWKKMMFLHSNFWIKIVQNDLLYVKSLWCSSNHQLNVLTQVSLQNAVHINGSRLILGCNVLKYAVMNLNLLILVKGNYYFTKYKNKYNWSSSYLSSSVTH